MAESIEYKDGKNIAVQAEGEFVVLMKDRQGFVGKNGVSVPDYYHGHVRNWADLSADMQSALIKAKIVDKKGKLIK